MADNLPNAPPAPRPLPKKPADPQVVDKLAKDVNTVGANLRILEERFALMRNKGTSSECFRITTLPATRL